MSYFPQDDWAEYSKLFEYMVFESVTNIAHVIFDEYFQFSNIRTPLV